MEPQIVQNLSFIWPKGKIYYWIDEEEEGMSANLKQRIREALKEWNLKVPGCKWIQNHSQPQAVRFYQGNSNALSGFGYRKESNWI